MLRKKHNCGETGVAAKSDPAGTGETKFMIEIRIHGRGGQGAVTSAEMIALAAIEEQKYAQGFPSFGPERRGAPVVAFARVDEKPIRLRSKIYHPDVAVVLDPTLLKILDPSQGLKPGGLLIINTNKSIQQIKAEFGYQARIATVDADLIAREELGLPITNTTMIGALVRATGLVQLDSMIQPLQHRFGKGAERNVRALRRAFNETVLNN
jgi:pyruvate ferredoxin oxidoreductase gamma subunit